ncbi:LysR substrate-binding domain-containing protein [Acerihabitans sp. KWT182]|uniref:LysR substrate-binding domain-containing protein n=1 Tax=Acerihabitans sp. KWT182 TaxID=3157919 RepID=A0AAU7QE76_9GAMM
MNTTRMPTLASLKAFDAVATHGSFKRAAQEISVTPTAISHQIRALEETLRTAMFVRGAREVTLTAAGKILYQATRRAFADMQDAVNTIVYAQQQPVLTLTTTSNFLTHWLVPRLSALKDHCPEMELRLHTGIELVDLTKTTMDAAIRYSIRPAEHLHSTLLYEDTFVLAASPALAIKKPEDLLSMTLFHVDNRLIPQPSPDWVLWRSRFGPAELDIEAGPHFSDETHAIQGAIAGQGVAIVSRLLVKDFIDKQILCTPFSGRLPGANYYFVTTREQSGRQDLVRLREWLLTCMT